MKAKARIKAKAIIKAIVTLLIIAFMAWVLISWHEVRAHNEAMLYGNEHEYSEANFFVLYNNILHYVATSRNYNAEWSGKSL